jgi:hypothetical protein
MSSNPVKRRKPGRPPKDDQLIVDVAEALRLVHGLGRQRARDLAIAYLEGAQADPKQIPRGKHAPGSVVVAFRLPCAATFKGRSGTVQRKRKPPRPGVVLALAMLLRGRDEAAIHRCARQLALMPEQHARRAVSLLLDAVAQKPHN